MSEDVRIQRKVTKLSLEPLSVVWDNDTGSLFINRVTGVVLLDLNGSCSLDPAKGPRFSVDVMGGKTVLVLRYCGIFLAVANIDDEYTPELRDWASAANACVSRFSKDSIIPAMGKALRLRAGGLVGQLIRDGMSGGFTLDDMEFVLGDVVHDAIDAERPYEPGG